MKAKIGARLVETLKPMEKPYEVHDSQLPGFIVRVQPTGIKTYVCSFRIYRRRTRVVLGRTDFFSADEARTWAYEILGSAKKGMDPSGINKTTGECSLRSFLNEKYGPWLRARQKKGEERNDAKAEARAKATLDMIETSFADFLSKSLKEITPWLVEKWKMKTLNGGAKSSTVNRKMDALRALYSKAVKWKLISENPFSHVEWCEMDDNSIVRYLSDDESMRLNCALDQRETRLRAERRSGNEWRRIRGHELLPDLNQVPFADHLKPMVILSRNLGVRRGELFSLEMHHIDLRKKIITVVGDNAKNGKTRHIPLNRVAYEALIGWIHQRGITDGLLFPGENGKPMNNVNKSWKALLEDAKIEKFRWHDMRHDFASRLVMNGVDLNTARELLGHSDLKMTLRYAHLAPRVKADAVAKLDLVWKTIQNDQANRLSSA